MKDRIINYVRAGFAGLYIVTHEEVRAEALLKAAAVELGYSLYGWSLCSGLVNPEAATIDQIMDPVEAVEAVGNLPEKSILLLRDFHRFLGDPMQPPNPVVLRAMREQIRRARTQGKVIVVVGCDLNLPSDLQKEFTVIDLPLPGGETLATLARAIAESAEKSVDDDMVAQAAEAASGLTTQEAEDVFALSIVREGTLDPATIAREKALTVRKNGILEIIEPDVTADDIGGLQALKQWLSGRRHAFTREAEAFGLPTPKGVLILGIPGTGKSLTAKAASAILQRPILKLDAGKLFAGIVGESEANLRRAIQTAEAIAPCVLWIDEIEKGMSGSRSSSSTDGGTSARIFGSFISWMQDKAAPVFVVATANDISQIPPEMLRKGRFDELFFVDLPDEAEREAIWRIHIAKRDRDPGDMDLRALVKATDGFTGSEIEQAVVDALFDCFDGNTDLTTSALTQAVERTVPLSVTMAEEIKSLRKWADHRARSASGQPKAVTTQRRLAA